MVVLLANHVPNSVRGKLKLWFLEPRANIFVSLVGGNVLDKILEGILPLFPKDSGLIIIRGNKRRLEVMGMLDPGVEVVHNCGVPLLNRPRARKTPPVV